VTEVIVEVDPMNRNTTVFVGAALLSGAAISWWWMRQQRTESESKTLAVEEQKFSAQDKQQGTNESLKSHPTADEVAEMFQELSKQTGRLVVELTTWEAKERQTLIAEGLSPSTEALAAQFSQTLRNRIRCRFETQVSEIRNDVFKYRGWSEDQVNQAAITHQDNEKVRRHVAPVQKTLEMIRTRLGG